MKDPKGVFTPRKSRINDAMYVPRPKVERQLALAIKSGLHIVVPGVSGVGKTWLYQRVLSENACGFEVLSLSSLGVNESLSMRMARELHRISGSEFEQTGYVESKSAKGGIGFAEAGLSHEKSYERVAADAFGDLCLALDKKSNSKDTFIVFDNLESVIGRTDVVQELANCIMRLDDPNLNTNVRIIIVGILDAVVKFHGHSAIQTSVNNRLREIPEVPRLTSEECASFARRGFEGELGVKVTLEGGLTELGQQLSWRADGIPQHVQELSLMVAYRLFEKGSNLLSMQDVEDGVKDWLSGSMADDFQKVRSSMNDRRTAVGRRNQVIYVMSRIDDMGVHVDDIKTRLCDTFKVDNENALNIPQMVSQLCERPKPIIYRSENEVRWVKPQYRIAARNMLIQQGDSVEILPLEMLEDDAGRGD